MARCSTTLVVILAAASVASGRADPVVDAGRARQDAAKTVDVSFHVKATYKKGTVTKTSPIKSKLLIPAEDTDVESDNRVVFDGQKVRYEYNHPVWNLKDGVLYRKGWISLSNGESGKTFFPTGIASSNRLTGLISADTRVRDISDATLTPLNVHLRGVDASFSPYPLQYLKPSNGVQLIDGQSCNEYTTPSAQQHEKKLWFAPTQGYVLRRIRSLRQGRVVDQTDIQYRDEPGFGLRPATWERVAFDADGRVEESVRVEVTAFRLNAPVPPEQFELTFPPGCHVFDHRDGKDYRVQPSGELREVLPNGDEVGPTVAQPGTPWYARNFWLLTGTAVSAVGLLGLYVRRRMRSGRA